MTIYLRTIKGQWEQVTAYVAKNRKHALNDDNTNPRYGEESIVVNDDGITINGTISSAEFSKVIRFLGLQPTQGTSTVPFVTEPDSIKFKIRNQTVLHKLSTNENWTRKAA